MRGVRQARWVIEIVPEIRLCEAFAAGYLEPAREVIVRIEVAGERLELRHGKRKTEAQRREQRVSPPAHAHLNAPNPGSAAARSAAFCSAPSAHGRARCAAGGRTT